MNRVLKVALLCGLAVTVAFSFPEPRPVGGAVEIHHLLSASLS